MRRFFVPHPIGDTNMVTLTGTDARHIITVLRMQSGDDLLLLDGTGEEFSAQVTHIGKQQVATRVFGRRPCRAESRLDLTVAQALLKDKKMDRLVRRLTELGVEHFIPWVAHRSVPRPRPQRLAARMTRWDRIAREAMKQCRRGRIPEIVAPLTLEELLATCPEYDLTILFWEAARTPLGHIVTAYPAGSVRRLLIILGPEGGFQDEEISVVHDQNITTASLGPRILRADTAALAACTLTQYLWGDLGNDLDGFN